MGGPPLRFDLVMRKGALLFVLASALAVPGTAAAGGAKSYPAYGPVIAPAVNVRANPSTHSKSILLLRDYRADGLTQYVLAVSQKRVGFVAAKRAKLVLKTTLGDNGLVLTARAGGKKGNLLSAIVQDDPLSSDPAMAELVIRYRTGVLQTISFSQSDLGSLAVAVNNLALPLTAQAATPGTLSFVSARHLAGGKNGKAGKLWLRIVMPTRPLNRKGWLPASAARIKPAVKTIVVNRTTHWLTVYKYGKKIYKTRVATGRPDRRTPAGLFYIAAKYKPPENMAVTAYALELSAPAGLPDFDFGGVIGIHGTHLLSSLGHNASNGCIRVSPSAALRLKTLIPTGTPIRVIG